MSCLTYYKLISEYECDQTKDCKLTTQDIDNNFYQLKGDDISAATYNSEEMVINITRNNGDVLSIDISSIQDQIDEAVSAVTGSSGSCECDIDISGELQEDGTLVLRWSSDSGSTSTTEIRGFLTERDMSSDETIDGIGKPTDPIRLSNTEKTGYLKNAIGIVDNLPSGDINVGDRYITKEKVNKFGRVYCLQGLSMVKSELDNEKSLWRIPTKQDWDKLLDYADECDNLHDSAEIDVMLGDVAGKVLKSVLYWDGNENVDEYGFGVVPAGFVEDAGELVKAGEESLLWTDTDYEPSLKYVKGFLNDSDQVFQGAVGNDYMCSIRLVRDIDEDNYVGDKVDILGNTYEVVNIPGCNQAWIKVNLEYNPGEQYSQQFSYEYPNIETDKYILNHWNGRVWEKRGLLHGDKVNVGPLGLITEYVCVSDTVGNQRLIKSIMYKNDGVSTHAYIDGGWF